MKWTKALIFKNELPAASELGDELLLIYDEILAKKSQEFKKWSQSFDRKYAVQAGENLKAIESFPDHIFKILKLCENTSNRKLTLVIAGGGSVGDFGGFVASVFKRGVRLIQIPSTWLSAIDSAHGGKTALNVGSAKNQIGSFYPAHKIILVKSLLIAQTEQRAMEGFGELLKISLINGGTLWSKLEKETEVNSSVLWKYLAESINAKYKVVKKDPLEATGYRHILNLGHTVGHALESYYKLPHGIAVNYGLEFALNWSVEQKIMSKASYDKMLKKPVMFYLLSPTRDRLFWQNKHFLNSFKSMLLQDKKKTAGKALRFVFLEKPGKCVVKEVTVDEILMEICRQQKGSN